MGRVGGWRVCHYFALINAELFKIEKKIITKLNKIKHTTSKTNPSFRQSFLSKRADC